MMHESVMVNLIGEQPAPNLLPVYEVKPARVLLIATDRTEPVAQRLSKVLRENGFNVPPADIVIGDAYDVDITVNQILQRLQNENRPVMANFTGGTKLMVLALLRFLKDWPYEKKLCYYRTEKSQGLLYFYDAESFQLLDDPRQVRTCLSLKDYLTAYLGEYRIEGPGGTGRGRNFEEIVAQSLQPYVDEVLLGLKKGGALDIDLVVRCGNQVGIAEVKTGKKARTKEGIDQLNTAGGRDFLGIYVKKFLIVDTSWEDLDNLSELAQARGIKVIELPSFGQNEKLSETDANKLVDVIRATLRC